MKSLRDEIQLRWEQDGFNFICEADFIRTERGFHRALRDFIEKTTNPTALLCKHSFTYRSQTSQNIDSFKHLWYKQFDK